MIKLRNSSFVNVHWPSVFQQIKACYTLFQIQLKIIHVYTRTVRNYINAFAFRMSSSNVSDYLLQDIVQTVSAISNTSSQRYQFRCVTFQAYENYKASLFILDSC